MEGNICQRGLRSTFETLLSDEQLVQLYRLQISTIRPPPRQKLELIGNGILGIIPQEFEVRCMRNCTEDVDLDTREIIKKYKLIALDDRLRIIDIRIREEFHCSSLSFTRSIKAGEVEYDVMGCHYLRKEKKYSIYGHVLRIINASKC